MPFNMFPYTNLHNLNLDWILNKVKDAVSTVERIAGNLESWAARLQAVENTVDGCVQYTAQSKTSEKKAQARTNIEAASSGDLSTVASDLSNLAEEVSSDTTAIGGLSASVLQHGLDINSAQADIRTLQGTAFRDVVVTLTSQTAGYISADEISFSDFQDLTKFYRLVAYTANVPNLVGYITQAQLITVGGTSNPRIAVQKVGILLTWVGSGTEPYEGTYAKVAICLTWDSTNNRTAVHMLGIN